MHGIKRPSPEEQGHAGKSQVCSTLATAEVTSSLLDSLGAKAARTARALLHLNLLGTGHSSPNGAVVFVEHNKLIL